MTNYALIKDAFVVNVITADDPAFIEILRPDYTDIIELQDGQSCGPGDAYENGEFLKPPAPPIPEPEPIRIISRFAFRSRFTTEEKQAIYTVSESNITIKIWLDDLASAENVDLDLPETVSNVTALESAGLIAEGRAAAILA